jgi:hypothetical protein
VAFVGSKRGDGESSGPLVECKVDVSKMFCFHSNSGNLTYIR